MENTLRSRSCILLIHRWLQVLLPDGLSLPGVLQEHACWRRCALTSTLALKYITGRTNLKTQCHVVQAQCANFLTLHTLINQLTYSFLHADLSRNHQWFINTLYHHQWFVILITFALSIESSKMTFLDFPQSVKTSLKTHCGRCTLMHWKILAASSLTQLLLIKTWITLTIVC